MVEAKCGLKWLLETVGQQLVFYLQASKLPTAPTAIAVVPCAFAAVPFAKFQYKLTYYTHRGAPFEREIAVPVQEGSFKARSRCSDNENDNGAKRTHSIG